MLCLKKPHSLPWIALLAVLAGSLTAAAQDFSADAIAKANPYKDLPGVHDQKQDEPREDEAECAQELELRNFRRHDDFGPSSRSGIVYRCTRNGITVESERPPLRKNWNPMDIR